MGSFLKLVDQLSMADGLQDEPGSERLVAEDLKCKG